MTDREIGRKALEDLLIGWGWAILGGPRTLDPTDIDIDSDYTLDDALAAERRRWNRLKARSAVLREALDALDQVDSLEEQAYQLVDAIYTITQVIDPRYSSIASIHAMADEVLNLPIAKRWLEGRLNI